MAGGQLSLSLSCAVASSSSRGVVPLLLQLHKGLLSPTFCSFSPCMLEREDVLSPRTPPRPYTSKMRGCPPFTVRGPANPLKTLLPSSARQFHIGSYCSGGVKDGDGGAVGIGRVGARAVRTRDVWAKKDGDGGNGGEAAGTEQREAKGMGVAGGGGRGRGKRSPISPLLSIFQGRGKLAPPPFLLAFPLQEAFSRAKSARCWTRLA